MIQRKSLSGRTCQPLSSELIVGISFGLSRKSEENLDDREQLTARQAGRLNVNG
jgi:hypothetical protein